MAMVTTESSESPPPMSFSSLPNDVALNILARISRIHYPTLSLLSKTFQSTLASRDLYVTRALIGNTEKCFYLCLKPRDQSNDSNDKPLWYTISKQQKLIAIPSFPYEHPESPSVVSTGSEIYIIGGYITHRRSRNVFLLDCRSHQWHRLADMLVPRGNSAAALYQGKIYVFGGCDMSCNNNLGEIYDPKTQSWEPISPTIITIPDLEFEKSVMTRTYCFVGEEKIMCRASEYINLQWCDLEDNLGWREVKEFIGLPKFVFTIISVANPEGGRKVTVWFLKKPHFIFPHDVEIWSAEISFERRSRKELFGIVEWSKMIYIWDRSKFCSFLSSSSVTL